MVQASSDRIRVADKIKFYGKLNCISCTYLLPILNFAQKHRYSEAVDIALLPSMDEYIKSVSPHLSSFGYDLDEFFEKPFAPTIFFQIKGRKALVNPEIVQESADEIIDRLQALGDEAAIDYMDGELAELDINVLLGTLLLKMACNLQYN